MRKKRKEFRKLHRNKDQRKALIKNLARSLFLHEKIETTLAKAKEVSKFAERIITKAKKGDLNARRYVARFFEKELVKKIVDEIAPRYKDRNGGYTRIYKLPSRPSDSAKMAIIELIK